MIDDCQSNLVRLIDWLVVHSHILLSRLMDRLYLLIDWLVFVLFYVCTLFCSLVTNWLIGFTVDWFSGWYARLISFLNISLTKWLFSWLISFSSTNWLIDWFVTAFPGSWSYSGGEWCEYHSHFLTGNSHNAISSCILYVFLLVGIQFSVWYFYIFLITVVQSVFIAVYDRYHSLFLYCIMTWTFTVFIAVYDRKSQ